MTIKEFLQRTAEKDDLFGFRPHIYCVDGFRMSVQAGPIWDSFPKTVLKDGNYSFVEVGFPSQPEEMLKPYSDNRENIRSSACGRVPVALVDEILEKHGGIDTEKVFPSDKEVAYEDF